MHKTSCVCNDQPFCIRFLFYIALKGNGFSQNAYNAGFSLAADEDGFIGRIFRLQHGHASGEVTEPLQGGFVVDEHCGDFSIVHGILAADEYDVAVLDAGKIIEWFWWRAIQELTQMQNKSLRKKGVGHYTGNISGRSKI